MVERTRTMNIKSDTLSYRFLALVAMSGEFPLADLHRLLGGSSYISKMIYNLKKEKLIRKYQKDHIASYRLTAAAKRWLLEERFQRFEYFLTGTVDTNVNKCELPRRLRLHRISETYLIMGNAGVEIYRDLKTPLFVPPDGTDCTDDTVCTAEVRKWGFTDIRSPSFYDSKEIRELGLSATKTKGARATGVLITDKNLYVTYNTSNTLMAWDTRSEEKFRELVNFHFHRNVKGYVPNQIRCLMIGETMDTALQILNSDGGFKRRYLMLDEAYEHFHFVPNDANGDLMIRVLCDCEIMNATRSLLLSDLYPAPNVSFVSCDGVDALGNLVLLAFDCDLRRIKSFVAGLALRNQLGTIICFDFQSEAIAKYCGSGIKLQTIDTQKYKRRYFP